jgi:very-short-patch-repair endonuclease
MNYSGILGTGICGVSTSFDLTSEEKVDGDSHFMPGAEKQDKARQEYIETLGIHFLRFTNVDVLENLDGVCQRIFDEIETHGTK